MLFVSALAWSSLAMSLASAASSNKYSSTSSSPRATHTVKVGPRENPHQYVPHNVSAAVGDVVLFEFYPTNHSVVQADYMAPCVPARGDVFYSGPVNDFNLENGLVVGEPPTWSVVVNDTKPTFFYCTAIDSCLVNGMVGTINQNASQTWEDQYQKALQYPYMLVPGQSMPAEGQPDDSSPSNTSDASSPSATAAQTSPATATPSPDNSGLSGGAIAGIVVGVVAFVAVLVALFFVLGRNRVYQKWMSSQDSRTERTARWALFNTKPAAQAPGDQAMAVWDQTSPDTATGPLSPSPQQPSGHWSWKFQQQAPYQQPAPPAPTELEATSVGQVYPQKGS
ncbi:hypothetical protein PHISP_02556 [Aspergillus sp. HF37]|nr:hypothetical protein PHISP_02556 [Aspergillus sp. HF37]